MTHRISTEKTITQINNDDNSPDSPAVIAYRLGQVESAVKEGFIAHNTKLDKLIDNFATKAEVLEIKNQATSEHGRLWAAIKGTGTDLEEVQKSINKMANSNVSMSLVQKIVFGLIGLVGLALSNALVTKFFNLN